MFPLWNSPRDWFRWFLFETGAGYYTDKLARGPESKLRALLAAAGLASIKLERRMAGLVWFARGRKPAGP